MLAYYVYLLASFLAPRVPRALGYRVCDIVGALGWRVAGRARTAVGANLRHALGHPPRQALVRSVFQNAARNYFDTFVIPSVSDAAMHRWARVQGVEHLDQALRHKRGAILAGAHLSSAALAAQALASLGYPMTVVVEPLQPQRLHDLVNSLRMGRGVRMIPLQGQATARQIIRELRANRVVGLMLDRDVNHSGELVRFFDADARVPLGPAVLSLATGAPILPTSVIRRRDGTVEGVIELAIDLEMSGDRDSDARKLTRRVLKRLEYHIRQVPGQWTLLVPVWAEASRPLGAPRLQST